MQNVAKVRKQGRKTTTHKHVNRGQNKLKNKINQPQKITNRIHNNFLCISFIRKIKLSSFHLFPLFVRLYVSPYFAFLTNFPLTDCVESYTILCGL